jgi:hypothetical protein
MNNFTKSFVLAFFCLINTVVFALPKLNSYPTATATIYLDFDGHMVTGSLWNGGMPIACIAPALTDAQITEIFNRVSEDYRPFNVNITTDSTKFLSAPLAQRIRVIVTPTSAWKPNVGGISYIGSFTWGDDTPAFVFSDRLGPNNTKFIAECCSHESGHTLGLSHQSKYDSACNLIETYNTGYGTGETSWAPIMGNSYSRNMTGWNDGATPYGCANTQDNLSIITSTNGFGYRTDDYSDSLNATTFSPNNTSFSINGIIATGNDKDAFKFNITQNTSIHIDATPFNLGTGNNGSNLDIKIMLYDQNKVLMRTYDAVNIMSISIDTTLKTGTYYFVLDGTGNAYASNYGSIGSYTLTGFRTVLPIKEVTLSGNTDNNKHNLSWNVISDEPLQSVTVEYSTDGMNFNVLNSITLSSRTMSYLPNDENTRYYRMKAVSYTNQIMYSNVIALRGISKPVNPFIVSTLVHQQITVNAFENYQYAILDANGRMLSKGTGNKGFNNIDVSRFASGFYVIQLYGTTTKQTERIIKQ